MLRAVVSHLRSRFPGVKLAAYWNSGKYEQRAALGLHQMLWEPSLKRVYSSLGYLVIRRYRQSFGILVEHDLDAVIDFSGYAYGDPWDARNICIAAKVVETLRT